MGLATERRGTLQRMATCLLVAAMAALLAAPVEGASTADCERLSSSLLDSVRKQQWDAATLDFDRKMQELLPPAKVAAVIDGIVAKLGRIERFGDARSETQEWGQLVTTPVHFAGGSEWDALVGCDSEGKVAGFRLVPHAVPEKRGSGELPGYADASLYREVAIEVGPTKLHGVLALPREAHAVPGVVLIHGSGPGDMDETVGPNKPFRDLAAGLASRGVAVMRYDKRTRAHPELFARGDYTLADEALDDAHAALALMRTQSQVDPARVFLLGHSMGASLAPFIAKSEAVKGVILAAAPARPPVQMVRAQMTYLFNLDGVVTPDEQAAIDRLDAQMRNFANAGGNGELPFGLPRAYLSQWLALDPLKDVTAGTYPVLLVQGARDYQVTVPDDFAVWMGRFGSDPRFTFKRYPGLNHLLMQGEGRSTPAEYERDGHVSEAVVADIARWIEAH